MGRPWTQRALGCVALSGLSVLAHAAEQDPAQRLLNEQRERERVETMQQEKPRVSGGVAKEQDALAAEPARIDEVEPAFRITRITLEGNTQLSEAQIAALAAPYLKIPLGRQRINALLRRVTTAYLDAGYITTRVYLGEQNLASGTLVLTVLEGRIEQVTINDQAPSIGMRMALPFAQGDSLKLEDLEQGVDQINRLRMNRAEMQILPGQSPGGSVLALKTQEGDHFYFNAGADNHGSSSSGRGRVRAGMDVEDLFGLQESIATSYVGSRESNALMLSASVPWGYNTFSYTHAYSESQSLVADTALMYSDSRTHTLAWNRVVDRSRSGKTSVDLSFNHRTSRRFINDAALSPQRLSSLRLSANRMFRFDTAVALLDLGFAKGTPGFNATKDLPGLPKESAHARFRKLDLNASVQWAIQPAWLFKSSLNGQWTGKALYSPEQIFLGGASSQRGTEEGLLAGDRGLSMRNELVFSQGWHPKIEDTTLNLQPFVFLDYGQVELIASPGWERLASTGVGARLNQSSLDIEFIAGKAIQAPDFVRKGAHVHASFSYRF